MSDDNAFNGKLGVNMVLDSTPYTGPRVHAKENPRVSELSEKLRGSISGNDVLYTNMLNLRIRKAADALEAKDKLISELVEASEAAAQRLRYCGDLWYDQGLEMRAKADWESSDRLNLLISKAKTNGINE